LTTAALKSGDSVEITIVVAPSAGGKSTITATLSSPDGASTTTEYTLPRYTTEGYFGIAALETSATATGRVPTCKLPVLSTLANADVRFATLNGRPIRGTRSDANGKLSLGGLIGPGPGDRIILTAHDGKKADAQLLTVS
jgi:hypothetical protein